MTPSPCSQLERDGFAILPPLLSDAQLDSLSRALTMEPNPGERGIYARRDVLDIPLVRTLCERELGEIARQVLGGQARSVRGILFDKVPGANWKVPWHQDLTIAAREAHDVAGFGPWSVKDGVPHVQPPAQVLEAMLTLRLHIDACPRANGALRVLPGTQRSGRLDAAQIQHERARGEERVCEVERGGVLAMKPLLLHASSASDSPSHRRVLHIEWAAHELPDPLEWFYSGSST
jgi:hypothetical protein